MRRIAGTVLVLIVAFSALPADAGLFQGIYRGLEYAATPLGSPLQSTGDGTRVNGSRSGRLRIVPSGLGEGYQLEFDRTFGNDSQGRPETLRLGGLAELTLSGGIQATAGYSGRSDSKFKNGQLSLTASNLSYAFRSTLGVQDVVYSGTLNVSNAVEINSLGFYNASITVSNANSQLVIDGVAVKQTQPTNFDVGPINIKGNIYADGGLAMLTSLGFDTTELEALFPQSPIDRIDDAIRQQILASAGATAVAGESVVASDTAPLLVQSILQQDEQAAKQLLEELVANAGDPSGEPVNTFVPEPGTLLLATAGALGLWSRRRR